MNKRYEVYSIAILFIVVIFTLNLVSAASPSGATVTAGTPTTANASNATHAYAYAGNITYLGLYGLSTTQSWQGFYGNVTGVIQLADSGDNVMYNWSLANPTGEVYSSTNSTIRWSNIQCFNFTANNTFSSEDGQGGGTNQQGINLSRLESIYSIAEGDVDGVNETFTILGGGHDAFTTASQSFSAGECYSTRVYNETAPVADQFEEALLYEPNTTSIVFASLLERNLQGFNDQTSDFEMLVLENGHGSDVSMTTYYFFVELQ